MLLSTWKAFFPENGDTEEDAFEFKAGYALQAAELAAEYNLNECEGHLRLDRPFKITVISPEGSKTHWVAWHEATIESAVKKITEEHDG